MKYKKIGLALGGGGGKGSYQIGVFKALKEFKLDQFVQIVSGTSIGAINGLLFLEGDIAKAERVWNSLTSKSILTLKKKTDYLKFKNFSLFSRTGFLSVLEREIDVEKAGKSKVPLYVVTTNLNTDAPNYFLVNNQQKEDIEKFLMASSAIPKVFETVVINGEKHMDGYKYDNVPLQILKDSGCDLVFVVPLGKLHTPYGGMYDDLTIINFKDDSFDDLGYRDGTFAFDGEIANERINLGYNNACKIIKMLLDEGVFCLTFKQKIRNLWRIILRKKKLKKYYSLYDALD